MKPKQTRCIELMVAGDLKQREIAERLKVSQATICNWKKEPVFQQAFIEAVRSRYRDVAGYAMAREVALLDANSESVRLAAARDILDRAGIRMDDEKSNTLPPVVVISGRVQE